MPQSRLSRRWLTTTIATLLITLFLFTIFSDRGLLHLWRLSDEKRKLDESNFRLQRANEALREQIYRLRHDNLYLEKIAREDLGLVRRGEFVYRFTSSETEEKRTESVNDAPPGPFRSWEQKLHP
ncbi:MAG: septum formation initiator family protein [Candidatus Binatia bacterium]